MEDNLWWKTTFNGRQLLFEGFRDPALPYTAVVVIFSNPPFIILNIIIIINSIISSSLQKFSVHFLVGTCYYTNYIEIGGSTTIQSLDFDPEIMQKLFINLLLVHTGTSLSGSKVTFAKGCLQKNKTVYLKTLSKIEVDPPPSHPIFDKFIFDKVLIMLNSLPPLEFLTKIMKF